MQREISFELAHPNAQKVMKDDFYYSVIDQFAPFGDDDSWETFMALQEWMLVNKGKNKLLFIEEQINYWGYEPFDLRTLDSNAIKEYIESNSLGNRYLYGIDEAIVATAIGQLYLEGFIDLNIRSLAAIAIKRQLLPFISNTYPEEYREDRARKLKKVLEVLEPNI